MSPKDLEPFSESVSEMFTRLGLPDPELMAAVSGSWEEVAGGPWKGRSKPMYIRGTELVVEASSPSIIAFLRYDEAALLDRLETLVGSRKIESVDIRPPSRG